VKRVTKAWARHRKAEERHRDRVLTRLDALDRRGREKQKHVAYEIMPWTYERACEGINLAQARQIMYVARGPIQDRTGKPLDDKYFTQTLLPDYLHDHPEETKDWDVVFDARGHFREPHTSIIVPLGTLDVREYLGDVRRSEEESVELLA